MGWSGCQKAMTGIAVFGILAMCGVVVHVQRKSAGVTANKRSATLGNLSLAFAHISRQTQADRRTSAIRSAYLDQALDIKGERMLRTKTMAAGISRKQCELTIVLPTGHRKKLGRQGYKYLKQTLDSIRHQHKQEHGFEQICVLVVDNTPTTHDDMVKLRWEMQGQQHRVKASDVPDICYNSTPGDPLDGGASLSADGTCHSWQSQSGFCGAGEAYMSNGNDCRSSSWIAKTDDEPQCQRNGCKSGAAKGGIELVDDMCLGWCFKGICGNSETFQEGVDCHEMVSTDIRFVKQSNFNDPFETQSGLAKSYYQDGHDDQNIRATTNTRRQGLHLSHSLLEASRWHSKYLMIVEDDMPFCNASALTHIFNAVILTENVCALTDSGWSMLRVGFGGNGVLIHWDDAVAVGQYLISNLGRRPIDWLMPEWAASQTFEALMVNARRRIYTYRYNLFKHIGMSSSIQSFDWNTTDTQTLPQCYELNVFLRPEETFKVDECRAYDISPCEYLNLKVKTAQGGSQK